VLSDSKTDADKTDRDSRL